MNSSNYGVARKATTVKGHQETAFGVCTVCDWKSDSDRHGAAEFVVRGARVHAHETGHETEVAVTNTRQYTRRSTDV